jgi:hypothetical protein
MAVSMCTFAASTVPREIRWITAGVTATVQQVVALKSALQKPSQATVLAMKLSAERAGCHAVSHELSNEPLCLEQEALDAQAPFLCFGPTAGDQV